MMVSTKGRYALRVMVDLAEHNDGSLISLQEIAERQEISKKYLESIVSTLVKGGLVLSHQGKNGGYRLARKPEDYTVAEILELTEGPLAPVKCVGSLAFDCPRSPACKTYPLWAELDEVINNFLSSRTLSSLLAQDEEPAAEVSGL